MTDRPIIFSAPMVKALLAGTKTQTRRLIKSPRKWAEKYPLLRTDVLDGQLWWWDGIHDRVGASAPMPYAVGDRLWVRENCWSEYRGHSGTGVLYPADGAWIKTPDTQEAEDRWRKLDCYASSRHPDNDTNTGQLVPSIHMPRWASRLTLTVTDVRVQQLQEIRDRDCIAEGIHPIGLEHRPDIPRREFSELWNRLHGAGAWEVNPHVVALSFTVEQRNIDTP